MNAPAGRPGIGPGETVTSPCVDRCCLDDDDVCLGCGRHVREIIEWSSAGNERRLAIREAAAARAAAREPARTLPVTRPPGRG